MTSVLPSVCVIAGGRARGRIDVARCEWNWVLGMPAEYPSRDNDCQNEAEVVVGKPGDWRLCRHCAALPRFKRYKVRRPIRKESDKT